MKHYLVIFFFLIRIAINCQDLDNYTGTYQMIETNLDSLNRMVNNYKSMGLDIKMFTIIKKDEILLEYTITIKEKEYHVIDLSDKFDFEFIDNQLFIEKEKSEFNKNISYITKNDKGIYMKYKNVGSDYFEGMQEIYNAMVQMLLNQ